MPGNFLDQDRRPVYRQSGLGDEGLIFRFEDESVYVYWNTAALYPQDDEDNWTAPFTTADYNATIRLRCRAAGDSEFGKFLIDDLRFKFFQPIYNREKLGGVGNVMCFAKIEPALAVGCADDKVALCETES